MTPASRVILTYNAGGVPFEWGNLSSAQQDALTTGDPSQTPYRLNYLRGDRSNEITTGFTCTGGPPVVLPRAHQHPGRHRGFKPHLGGPAAAAVHGNLAGQAVSAGGAPGKLRALRTICSSLTAEQTRPNVVYVGSNDGMMHGFRSGGFDSAGNFTTATTPNDGQEVLAYMPGSLLLSASTGGACATFASTGSVVQNIHGVTPPSRRHPAPPSRPASPLRWISPAPSTAITSSWMRRREPVTCTYNGAWHTWLVSGLGAGGAAIFALDVTNPTASNFVEGNAVEPGDRRVDAATITCVGNTTCGNNLGNTFGTPIIRRLHDGRWAVIFGNGFGSASGDAGIFIMTVDNTGNQLFYYLSTGNSGTANNNGIAYVSSADLDGDHVTDYRVRR